MTGRSVVTNLIIFVDYVFYVLDKSAQVDVVHADFRISFNKVGHSLLFRKLSASQDFHIKFNKIESKRYLPG